MPARERLERATKRLADRELVSDLLDLAYDEPWTDCDDEECEFCRRFEDHDAIESLQARMPWSVTLGDLVAA